jgi:hypothetical protein
MQRRKEDSLPIFVCFGCGRVDGWLWKVVAWWREFVVLVVKCGVPCVCRWVVVFVT